MKSIRKEKSYLKIASALKSIFVLKIVNMNFILSLVLFHFLQNNLICVFYFSWWLRQTELAFLFVSHFPSTIIWEQVLRENKILKRVSDWGILFYIQNNDYVARDVVKAITNDHHDIHTELWHAN